MNRQADRKEQTRQAMLAAASQNFRAQGFAGASVDTIAKDAGATSGAFYAHLGSKDRAFLTSLENGLDEVPTAILAYRRHRGAAWLASFAEDYFAPAHRQDRAGGCAMTSLSPEVARSSPEAKTLYEQKMARIASDIADGLAGGSAEDRIGRAWAFLGALIGGLSMARAVETDAMAEAIAHFAKISAIAAAGATTAAPPDEG